MGSRLPLKYQVSRLTLRGQMRLIMHTKNPKDLIRLIFPSESSTSPGCRFRLTLWERETLSLLVSDGIHLGPDGMIPERFHVYPE